MSTNTRESDSSARTEKESSSKEYLKYANHKYIGWLKHLKKTSLPKMHRSMMHYTSTGIIIICVVNDKLVFYSFDANTNKTHELANFSLAEYFHVGGEFIHYQSFLINQRYIYIIKNSFPTDEEHIFIFEIQSKKLLSIKNDDTRPQTFRMNHSVTVADLKFYFFGGLNSNLECLNSMDVYNFETYKWEQITTKGKSPDPRHSHSSFIVGPNLYILGGTKSTDFFSKEGSFDDFFMLNLTNLTWTPIKMYGTPPKSLSYNYTFQLTKKYILFVSCDKGRDSCEINVKRFDINHYEWEDMELVSSTPEFRYGCGHCFDEESMTCFMFGGLSLSKVEAQSLTNEMDRIKISDQKDSFKSEEVLMVEKPSEVVVKNRDEPKSSERESVEGDSESEEISFEELLEREKRLQEEEKTKVQPKKGKKKVQQKKKKDSKSKTDNLD